MGVVAIAAAETARLIAELTLKDKLTPGSRSAVSTLDKMDRKLGTISKRTGAFSGAVNRALSRGVDSLVNAGFDALRGGIDSLVELESATTSVDGAIRRMGLTGKVTASQVAQWANEIESDVQAAFDDKDIARNAATLIRYGRIAPQNLRPAMAVMTDLAARTGSVDSASKLLAKALADPTKAAGALRKAGVVLTKKQEDQIKALVKSGKTAKAQAVIIAALAKTTKGAARDMNGPMKDAQNTLADVGEDAKRAFATGFLPVLQRVQTGLSKALADPAVIQRIKDFGGALAGAFDKAVTFVQGVDWKGLGDGLKVAGDWAGKLFDKFMSLPPEVKGTLLALAGLNKLSGGAVTGIVSELGKGLIKGVLGMTAGVVNLKAASVIGGGGGGLPNVLPAAAAGAGGLSLGGAAAIGIGTLTVGLIAAQAIKTASGQSDAEWQGTVEASYKRLGIIGTVLDQVNANTRNDGLPTKQNDPTGFLNTPMGQKLTNSAADTVTETNATKRAVLESKVAAKISAAQQMITTAASGTRVGSAVDAGAARISAAVANARPIITTNVQVNVTAASVTKSVAVSSRFGSTNGSRGGGKGGIKE